MSTPIPEAALAWLRQSAAVGGGGYSQLLLHLLERVEALEADAIEQSQSGSFCNEAIVRRLEALEAAQQQPVNHVRAATEMVPTPEAARVVTDKQILAMRSWSSHGPTFDSDIVKFGRKHGAAAAHPTPQNPMPDGGTMSTNFEHIDQLAAIIREVDGGHVKGAGLLAEAILSHPGSMWHPPAAQPAPPAAAAGGLVELVAEAMERHHVIGDIEGSWDAQARAAICEVAAWLDTKGQHGCSLLLRKESD